MAPRRQPTVLPPCGTHSPAPTAHQQRRPLQALPPHPGPGPPPHPPMPPRTCTTCPCTSSQCACLRLRSILVAGEPRLAPSRSLIALSTRKQRTGMPAAAHSRRWAGGGVGVEGGVCVWGGWGWGLLRRQRQAAAQSAWGAKRPAARCSSSACCGVHACHATPGRGTEPARAHLRWPCGTWGTTASGAATRPGTGRRTCGRTRACATPAATRGRSGTPGGCPGSRPRPCPSPRATGCTCWLLRPPPRRRAPAACSPSPPAPPRRRRC